MTGRQAESWGGRCGGTGSKELGVRSGGTGSKELGGRCGGTGSKELGVGGAGSETSREPRTNPRTEISFSGILRQFQAKLDTFNSFPFPWA